MMRLDFFALALALAAFAMSSTIAGATPSQRAQSPAVVADKGIHLALGRCHEFGKTQKCWARYDRRGKTCVCSR